MSDKDEKPRSAPAGLTRQCVNDVKFLIYHCELLGRKYVALAQDGKIDIKIFMDTQNRMRQAALISEGLLDYFKLMIDDEAPYSYEGEDHA